MWNRKIHFLHVELSSIIRRKAQRKVLQLTKPTRPSTVWDEWDPGGCCRPEPQLDTSCWSPPRPSAWEGARSCRKLPFGSRGMKKVDLWLAASSLRWVGSPALPPALQLAQTWPEVSLLTDLGRAALPAASSPFFGEKEGLEGPTKACVLCTQPVILPWMAWTRHTHGAGQLHRPRWAQRWLTAPQRGLHTRWKKPTKRAVGLDSL